MYSLPSGALLTSELSKASSVMSMDVCSKLEKAFFGLDNGTVMVKFKKFNFQVYDLTASIPKKVQEIVVNSSGEHGISSVCFA